MTFQFINADGSSVTSSFSFQPIIYPLTNGSYRVLADVINSSVAPATFSLVDNIYKVENNGESSNDWYINQSGSVISGSTSSGSLVNVTFNLENSNGISNLPIYFSLIPINKNIGFIDVSGSKFLVTGNRIDCVTDLTGSLTIPLVPNQPYKIKYVGKIKNCIDRILPTTDSNVNDCIVQSSMVSQTITPQNNSLYSYTAAASDLRYQSASYAISASYAPSQFIDTSSLVNNTTFNSYTSSNDAAINSLINVTSSYITNSQTSSMTVASSSFAISSSYSPVQIPNIQMFGNDVAINQNSRGGTYIGNPYGQLAISATPAIYFNVNSHLATTITEDGIVVAGDISCNNITASILGTSSWSNNSITASSITAANNTVLGYLNDVRSNIQTQLDQLNGNAGLTSVPTITNNNDGTITITSASVNLYDNPYGTGVITSYNIPQTTLALNPYLLNIVIAELSGGNAIYNITSNQTDVNDLNIIPVSGIEVVGVDGLGWHYVEFDFGATGLALPNKLALKDVSLNGNQRQSGLLLSAGSGTDFSISAGATWYSVNQTSFDVFDSYNYPTCITSYLVQSASVWSSSYGVGYINDYYNGPSGLTPLAPNSCSVNYIYKILANNINGAIVVVGGQYDTLLNAQSAPVPILPTSTADFALLTGRIIVQSGSTSPTVQSAYTTQFGAATISNHNDLLGLQGGQGGEYYHMTHAEYLGNGAGAFVRQSGTVASASAANSITFIPNLSNTASYVSASNVIGTVTSASYSLSSSAATSITFIPKLSNTASYVSASNGIVVGGNIVTTEAYLLGYNSNFIGVAAGAAGAWGSQFIGFQAGSGSTNAYQSVFIGDNTAINSPNANNSNFIGANTGTNATNANNSNFIGHATGDSATNAYFSNFIGYAAGNSATNANNSNFIGYGAGSAATNANNSIFIGYSAGISDTVNNKIVTGSSILIGDYTNTGGYPNSIAIGRGTKNFAAASLNIGNVIYATNIYSGSSTTATSASNSIGKVGIGTYNPVNALDVVGNISCSVITASLLIGTSSYSVSSSAANSITFIPKLSNTASYISSSNIVGTVNSSSYSITSSAANSITFIPNLSNTASYISSSNIVGTVNSSSYSLTSSYVPNLYPVIGYVTTSSFNNYTSSNDSKVNNLINSTSSYLTTASIISSSISASYVDNLYPQTYQVSSSWASSSLSASYVANLYPVNLNGYALTSSVNNLINSTSSYLTTASIIASASYSLSSSAATSITFIPDLSNTASYVSASGIVGTVTSASYSLTSSAANSITFIPNLSNTASYVTMSQTASYITSSNVIGTVASASAANSITFIPNLSNTASYVTTSQTASYISGSSGVITNLTSSGVVFTNTLGVRTLSGLIYPFEVNTNVAVGNYTIGENIVSVMRNNSDGGGFIIGFNASANNTIRYGFMRGSGNYSTGIGISGNASALYISYPTGHVGIGTTTPVNSLDVAGNISCSVITASLFNGTSTYSLTSSYLSGSIIGSGVTNIIQISSASYAALISGSTYSTTTLYLVL